MHILYVNAHITDKSCDFHNRLAVSSTQKNTVKREKALCSSNVLVQHKQCHKGIKKCADQAPNQGCNFVEDSTEMSSINSMVPPEGAMPRNSHAMTFSLHSN